MFEQVTFSVDVIISLGFFKRHNKAFHLEIRVSSSFWSLAAATDEEEMYKTENDSTPNTQGHQE